MLNKLILCFTLLISFLPFTSFTESTQAAKQPNKTAVYYIPHQDDEFLSMGVSILNHVDAGYDVHLVLVTDGEGSKMIPKFNLTKKQFGEARDREFIKSARALGVKYKNLHFMNLPDGKVTKQQMESIILKFEAKYPGAKHRAYSYYDKHNDHKVGGEALNALYNAKKVKDARFYINHGRYDTKGKDEFYKGSKRKLTLADGAYRNISKKQGLHGIGYRSAYDLFDRYNGKWKNKYHLANQ